MKRFKKELYEGLIHFRDRHQFELKSEFKRVSNLDTIQYTQEFYLFIPNSLGINRQTYSKNQFYRDQTNFIRYKTPEFDLLNLIEPSNSRSPFQRLNKLRTADQNLQSKEAVNDEVKLLGNIIRSAIRKRVRPLVHHLETATLDNDDPTLNQQILSLTHEIRSTQDAFAKLKRTFLDHWQDQELRQHFSHVDEFVCRAVDYHLTGLLKFVKHAHMLSLRPAERAIEDLILQQHPYQPTDDCSDKDERFCYRKGLLNKFVLDALLLSTSRHHMADTYLSVINIVAAAVAMLFFFLGFVWQGNIFIVNSAPFIAVTVFLYVIKDRMKEGIKSIYHQQASRWFPDYKTEIRTPSGSHRVGTHKETFAFIEPGRQPKDIARIRNREFHNVLETYKRPEKIMYYKSEVDLNSTLAKAGARRFNLNTIFRLNIHRFLEKSSDTHTPYTTLDEESHSLQEIMLPKVYHINIIVRSSYTASDNQLHSNLRKFRLVINKDGIQRVEQIFQK
ncbi:hypothetical protein SCG7086_BH_00090 [Chlamydiales bacterium SCGC AG-110-P3]|nr:hypothetical protein SCG7086_BH_00090 [Chlamydiales bacterium SCGC AG-110-P3]